MADLAIENAVETLAHLHNAQELRELIALKRAELLSDGADAALERMILASRDDQQALLRLRAKRVLLYCCREYGIDAAFTVRLHTTADDIVLEFAHAGKAAALVSLVNSHHDVLMSDEAERKLGELVVQYADDVPQRDALQRRRELLRDIRQQGLAKAMLKEKVYLVPPGLMTALNEFLSRTSDLRAVLLQHQEHLLTDQAEQLLMSAITFATGSIDSDEALYRERLELLRHCRAAGIDAALDQSALLKMLDEYASRIPPGSETIELGQRFMQELEAVTFQRGLMAEDKLRALMERKPQLALPMRKLAERGELRQFPQMDTAGFQQIMAAYQQAHERGDWSAAAQIAHQGLRTLGHERHSVAAAFIHYSIASALLRVPHGDRAQTLETALDHHERAAKLLQDQRETDFRQLWILNEHHRAAAWLQRINGDPVANVERGIEILRNLMEIPQPQWPTDFGINLSNAFRERPAGDATENVDEAILQARLAMQRIEAGHTPEDGYDKALLALGLAFLTRRSGDPVDNIEQAIEHIGRALKLIDSQTDLDSWAGAERALAQAYGRRRLGVPASNREAALAGLQRVLDRCPSTEFPEQWGETQLSLAILTAQTATAFDSAALLRAAEMAEAVLHIYSKHDWPMHTARVQLTLSEFFTALFRRAADNDAGAEYFDRAVGYSEATFRVFTRDKTPNRWSLIHETLGSLYARKASRSDERGPVIERAIDHFERALEMRPLETSASARLSILHYMATLRFAQQEWRKALRLYVDAMRAADLLLSVTHTRIAGLEQVSVADGLYSPAAYCLYRLGDVPAAFVCLEWGKSRLLAKTLALRDLDIAQLAPEQLQQIGALRRQLRELEAELTAPEKIERSTYAAECSRLRSVRENLAEALASLPPHHQHMLRSRLTLRQMRESVPSPGALIIPLISPQGSAIFIVLNDASGSRIVHVRSPFLTQATLDGIVSGTPHERGWRGNYEAWQAGQLSLASWRRAIRADLKSMWALLIAGTLETLNKHLPEGALVTIVQPGQQMFIPLHAASADGSGRDCLLDRFTVSYCPSIHTLHASQRRLAALGSAPISTVAAVNPTSDLPFSDSEGRMLETLLSPDSLRVLRGAAARASSVEAIRQATHLHFACHGIYDPVDIMKSGLAMADGVMTLRSILGSDLDLSATRLVTLSACDSGLIDTQYSADEFIGLPTAFLQGGACGVVSTLWPVPDRSTSLLMQHLYEAHLVEGVHPAAALRRAQLWLRDVTRAQIAAHYLDPKQGRTADQHAAFLEVTLGGPRDERPYSDPYYWAGFQFTGA